MHPGLGCLCHRSTCCPIKNRPGPKPGVTKQDISSENSVPSSSTMFTRSSPHKNRSVSGFVGLRFCAVHPPLDCGLCLHQSPGLRAFPEQYPGAPLPMRKFTDSPSPLLPSPVGDPALRAESSSELYMLPEFSTIGVRQGYFGRSWATEHQP